MVSAPEDFPAELRPLTTLDSTLRCPICKEFYQAPVIIHIPKCCHTFCSACIRTCFNNNSNNQKIHATGLGGVGNSHRCPICKVEAQEEKIKPIPTLEAVVISWQDAREEIFNIIDRVKSLESQLNHQVQSASSSGFSKQNQPEAQVSDRVTDSSSRDHRGSGPISNKPIESIRNSHDVEHKVVTRSSQASGSSKRKSAHSSDQNDHSDSDIELLSYNPTDPSAPVKCPICNVQMLNSNMDSHLTKCLSVSKTKSKMPSNQSKRMKTLSFERKGRGTKPVQEKIPLPHFASLKPNQIKNELTKHKLNLSGTPSIQTRRLSKFITLFNANLDSDLKHQKSIETIRKELYEWEDLQDSENSILDQKHRKIFNNPSDYLKLNKSHFDLLIDQASKSLKNKQPSPHQSQLSKPQVLGGSDNLVPGNTNPEPNSNEINPTQELPSKNNPESLEVDPNFECHPSKDDCPGPNSNDNRCASNPPSSNQLDSTESNQ